MALTYGLDGIVQKDYRVWICYPPDSYAFSGGFVSWDEWITISLIAQEYGLLKTAIDESLFVYMSILGECRKDSISLVTEDGDTVDGNEVGRLVLNKKCSFSAELINATPDNINELQDAVESSTPFYIVLEEIQGRTKEWGWGVETTISNDTRELIFIGVNEGAVAKISESIIGGDIPRLMIEVADTVAEVSQFRRINEMPYDLENYVAP